MFLTACALSPAPPMLPASCLQQELPAMLEYLGVSKRICLYLARKNAQQTIDHLVYEVSLQLLEDEGPTAGGSSNGAVGGASGSYQQHRPNAPLEFAAVLQQSAGGWFRWCSVNAGGSSCLCCGTSTERCLAALLQPLSYKNQVPLWPALFGGRLQPIIDAFVLHCVAMLPQAPAAAPSTTWPSGSQLVCHQQVCLKHPSPPSGPPLAPGGAKTWPAAQRQHQPPLPPQQQGNRPTWAQGTLRSAA